MSYRLLSLADKYEKKANDTILCIPLFLSKFADRRTYEQDASATCAVANIRLASHSPSLPPSLALSISLNVCLSPSLPRYSCLPAIAEGWRICKLHLRIYALRVYPGFKSQSVMIT